MPLWLEMMKGADTFVTGALGVSTDAGVDDDITGIWIVGTILGCWHGELGQ